MRIKKTSECSPLNFYEILGLFLWDFASVTVLRATGVIMVKFRYWFSKGNTVYGKLLMNFHFYFGRPLYEQKMPAVSASFINDIFLSIFLRFCANIRREPDVFCVAFSGAGIFTIASRSRTCCAPSLGCYPELTN